jgi:uncharacterized protein
MYMPTPAQVQEALGAMHGGYLEVVTERAPGTFMVQSICFLFFLLWRCGGMMLLGMALLKWGFLDGRRSAATYARAAVVCIPLGLALAGWGVVELERVRYAMPERTIPDISNYVGAVFASVGYAAALLLARYRFGPAEWLWRSLTYWQRQPMRGDTRRLRPAAV